MGFAGPLDLLITAALAIRRFGLRPTLWASILLSAVWLWSLPPVPCACLRPLFRRCAVSRPYQSWVKSDLKNLASQQEIYRADYGGYSTDLEALGFVPLNGVVVEVYAAQDGWAARAEHEALGDSEACSVFVGAAAPTGLGLEGAESGEIVCGD